MWLHYSMTNLRRKTTTPRRPTRKTEVVRMRVTEQEKQALVGAATKDGLGLSAWLRRLALRAANT